MQYKPSSYLIKTHFNKILSSTPTFYAGSDNLSFVNIEGSPGGNDYPTCNKNMKG
jgi:hypothetical protein